MLNYINSLSDGQLCCLYFILFVFLSWVVVGIVYNIEQHKLNKSKIKKLQKQVRTLQEENDKQAYLNSIKY